MLLNIDLSKLLSDYLPPMLRKPRMVAWLEALIHPTKEVYQNFSNYVLGAKLQLSYNSQTMVFEAGLNDLFDFTLRRIYIENNPAALPILYVYDRSESEPDLFIFDRSESEPDQQVYSSIEYQLPLGFLVVVPAALVGQDKALRTFIEKIKFSHIRYEIKYI